MTIVVNAQNLSKKYLISHQARERSATFRELLGNQSRALFGRLHSPRAQAPHGDTVEEFWALKEIDLQVRQGDRLGVIGPNGAGKSTLLKLLSRITEPTTGRISIRGRVASLLEVGTGFHPELTGRENIFLNGAILGMTRREIRARFDEIVDFSEVEQFLDTPVKRYSSGMYVRLAFSVAAHLDPEILVVDEVLAVGDASFQKKCLGKMEGAAREGRTVLFVSHNMAAIRSMCNRAILLRAGVKAADGDVGEVVGGYLDHALGAGKNAEVFEFDGAETAADPVAVCDRAFVADEKSNVTGRLGLRSDIVLGMDYRVTGDDWPKIVPQFRVFDQFENCIFVSGDRSDVERDSGHAPGRYEARCRIPGHWLNVGEYRVDVILNAPEIREIQLWAKRALRFSVSDETGVVGFYGDVPGVLRPRLDWTRVKVTEEGS